MSDPSGRNNYYRKKHWNKNKKRKRTEDNSNEGNEQNGTGQKRKKKDRRQVTAVPKMSNSPSEDESEDVCNIKRKREIPFYGWKLYFAEEFEENSDTVKKVKAMQQFILSNEELISTNDWTEPDNSLKFDINLLYGDEEFIKEWQDFKSDLYNEPQHSLNILGLAVYHSIIDMMLKDHETGEVAIDAVPMIHVRPYNYEFSVTLSDLRADYCGKLITTRGRVMRVAASTLRASWEVFTCNQCDKSTLVRQVNFLQTAPKKCDACGGKKFEYVPASPLAKVVTSQMIKLQQDVNEDPENKGKRPRTLDVEFLGDLVNSCLPGDFIVLTGIILDNDCLEKKPKNKKADLEFTLQMLAVSLVNKRNKNVESLTDGGSEMTLKDYHAIKEIHDEDNLFPLLVHSFCPDIYGNEMIKAGLVLSLFGGGSLGPNSRSEIHTLLIGDPGLGKSQMLRAITRVAPKAFYVGGNVTTSAGLTITLSKKEGHSNFAMEPGALVLADKGFCCVDELDKMPVSQQYAFLESMEQQTVSIAKAGITCTLPTKATIVAAANPVGGRYNLAKTFLENLNIKQQLLSRFDLVFLMLNRFDKKRDAKLCAHVMSVHRGLSKDKLNYQTSQTQGSDDSRGLEERLTSINPAKMDLLPHPLFRKYVTYARQYVTPILTVEAKELLQNTYIQLRKRARVHGGIPVTLRQFEAMMRLTEARAKVELRTEATAEDAQEVVEIIKFMMSEELTGGAMPAFDNLPSSSGRGKPNVLIRALQREGKTIFTLTELNNIAARCGIDNADRVIMQLNESGVLLKKPNNCFEFRN